MQEKIIEKFIDRPIPVYQDKPVYILAGGVEMRESVKAGEHPILRPPEIKERITNVYEGERRVLKENVVMGGSHPA